MLSMSDTKIENYIPLFAQTGIPVAFLVPTPTGFNKSIMDATFSIRQLFREQNVHDYLIQKQGPEHKVMVTTYLVTPTNCIKTTTSLYRPVTKMGDPRLWIYGLKRYCMPYNLLALIIINSELYVFNLSDKRVVNSIYNNGYCNSILQRAINEENLIAEELREKIQNIHDLGYIPSVTKGDPGVGDTLEHALGIGRNNRQNPDYFGIELKASRRRISAPNRSTLFDKTPDWSIALNEEEILNKFGYWGEDKNGNRRFQLYCTIRSLLPNPQGLMLYYNEAKDDLNVLCDADQPWLVTAWDMQILRDRLLEKHPATFWVKASVKIIDGWEHFRYDYIKYTRNPNISLFASLIAEGVVSVDFLMHRKPNGRIRDHGFPFKIMPNDIELLFPEIIEYDLTNEYYKNE